MEAPSEYSKINQVSQKQVYKVNKHNLKLISSINNMKLFFDFRQSNLNCESSFVGILHVLKEI